MGLHIDRKPENLHAKIRTSHFRFSGTDATFPRLLIAEVIPKLMFGLLLNIRAGIFKPIQQDKAFGHCSSIV